MSFFRPRLNNQSLNRIPSSSFDQARLFLERRLARRRFDREKTLSVVPVEDVLGDLSQCRVTMRRVPYTLASFGNMPAHEMLTLCAACAFINPKRIFEFGTYNGLTTLHLAMNSAADAEILTIDLAQDDPIRSIDTDDTFYTRDVQVGEHYLDCPERAKIQQIFGNTLTFDQTPLRGQIDFIFVDAGHEYPLVKSDSLKALEMVSPGGVIFWHDYSFAHRGVYSWLNELAGQIKLSNVPDTMLVYHINGAPNIRPRIAESSHTGFHERPTKMTLPAN